MKLSQQIPDADMPSWCRLREMQPGPSSIADELQLEAATSAHWLLWLIGPNWRLQAWALFPKVACHHPVFLMLGIRNQRPYIASGDRPHLIILIILIYLAAAVHVPGVLTCIRCLRDF